MNEMGMKIRLVLAICMLAIATICIVDVVI